MTRLIDADALKEKLKNRYELEYEDIDKGWNLGIGVAINLIETAPTVEPKITEVDNVSPCTNCQEFDCYGCKVKEADNEQ